MLNLLALLLLFFSVCIVILPKEDQRYIFIVYVNNFF